MDSCNNNAVYFLDGGIFLGLTTMVEQKKGLLEGPKYGRIKTGGKIYLRSTANRIIN